MNAHRAINVVVSFSQRLDRPGVISADANAEKVSDTPVTCRLKGSIQRSGMLGEVQAVKVAVGIYKHGIGNYIV
jgi:hypothetical protein